MYDEIYKSMEAQKGPLNSNIKMITFLIAGKSKRVAA